MRIALVSYEYLGNQASGGIGTYMRNLAQTMAQRGHTVEVFAGGDRYAQYPEESGVFVNLIGTGNRMDFPAAVVPVFLERHTRQDFDLIEGAEFFAETRGISKAAPDVPLVLKLHIPSNFFSTMGLHFVPLSRRARYLAGGLLRGTWPKRYWKYRAEDDFERKNLALANEVTAPCRAIAAAVAKNWDLNEDGIAVIPNVFIPPREMLEIPCETKTNTITFLGRLEMRKGVFDLAKAIPIVLRQEPNAKFVFVGRSLPHPGTDKDIGVKLRALLSPFKDAVAFAGGLPYREIPRQLANTDICVFPSLWENFPNVCLEAMAAGRGVIGSSAGGMAEIIEHGRTGLLIPPQNPSAIAEAILAMLRDPAKRIAMGRAARTHVTQAYSPEAIAPAQEASYNRAIQRALESRPRKPFIAKRTCAVGEAD